MFVRLRYILEMIRFSHTLFALPFALLAALMAWALNQHETPPVAFRWQQLAGIVCAMVFARSAAMAFNRLADWRLDARNPRTAARHIPSGLLTYQSVALFFVVCVVGFVLSTLWFVPNWLPLYLSAPVLAWICGYSFAKRFTSLAHFWLGAALMLAPVCAWIAVRGEAVQHDMIDLLPAVVLGAAVMLWVAGFDIIYACQDYEVDRREGLNSVPARLGVPKALRVATLCHAAMILLLVALPWTYPLLGGIYWAGIAAVAGLLIYEHSLVRPDDLRRVNEAFFQVNAVISVGLFLLGAADLWF